MIKKVVSKEEISVRLQLPGWVFDDLFPGSQLTGRPFNSLIPGSPPDLDPITAVLE